MFCSFLDIRNKMVVNLRNGAHMGTVCDMELDTARASVVSVRIKGRLRLFGLLGREESPVIPWEDIEVVGEDTILVNYMPKEESEDPASTPKKKKSRGKLLEILLEDD